MIYVVLVLSITLLYLFFFLFVFIKLKLLYKKSDKLISEIDNDIEIIDKTILLLNKLPNLLKFVFLYNKHIENIENKVYFLFQNKLEITLKNKNFDLYKSTIEKLIDLGGDEQELYLNAFNYFYENDKLEDSYFYYNLLKKINYPINKYIELNNKLFLIFYKLNKIDELLKLMNYYYDGLLEINHYNLEITYKILLDNNEIDLLISFLNYILQNQELLNISSEIIINLMSEHKYKMDIYTTISDYFYNQNQTTIALLIYDLSYKIFPDNFYFLEMSAYLSYSQSDFITAISKYETLKQNGYNLQSIYEMLIYLYKETYEIDKEIENIEKFLNEINNEDINKIERVGDLYFSKSEFINAVNKYVLFVNYNASVKVYEKIFECYYNLGNITEFINIATIFNKTVKNSLKHIKKFFKKFLDDNYYDKNLLEFIISLKVDKNLLEKSYFLLGQTYFYEKLYEKSIEYFNYLIKNSENYKYQSIDFLIEAWFNLGKGNLSVKMLQNLIDKEKKIEIKLNLTYKLGLLYKQLENYIKAKDIFEEILVNELKYKDVDTQLEEIIEKLSQLEQINKEQELERFKEIGKEILGSSKNQINVDRYQIIKKIGAGGMGEVFRALDKNLDREVALKIMKIMGDDIIDKAVKEAKIAAKFNHPNIISIYDVGELPKEHKWYISMEYFNGITLKQLILRKYPEGFDKETVLLYLQQIVNALVYAHQKNIIHRDIKPDNFMVNSNNQIKILDFGLAQSISNDVTISIDGGIVGTIQYMSPEQINSMKVDFKTDLYALACSVYEMFTGEVLFNGKDITSTIFLHMQEDVTKLFNEKFRETNPEIVKVLKKALSINKSERYDSLQDFLKELTDAKEA